MTVNILEGAPEPIEPHSEGPRGFIPLADVIKHFERAQAAVIPGMERVMGVLMAENAAMSKAMIGQEYNAQWAPLAKRTVEEKERLGYVNQRSATDPLLRTGELERSIEPVVHSKGLGIVVGEVGTDLSYAAALENGDKNMPPRPFISPPFQASLESRAIEAFGDLAIKLLTPGSKL